MGGRNMDTNLLEEKFKNLLESTTTCLWNEPEVYYFALGLILKRIFAELGGIDQHRSEFNYLTNPYIPANVQTLAIRIVMFLKKIKLHSKIQNEELISIIEVLLSQEKILYQTNIGLPVCETAFYSGLHCDN
jgi:hypothetical protein